MQKINNFFGTVFKIFIFLILVFFVQLNSRVNAVNIYDLTNPSNFNIKFTGVNGLSLGGIIATDINNDGKKDIIIATAITNHNSRQQSGSVYIIYNYLIEELVKTDNIIDLSQSSNYNLRFDGANPYDSLADWSGSGIAFGDITNDNKNDIVISAPDADYNSRSQSGSIYILFNSFINSFSNTGNNIDLADPENFNIRIDGATATEHIGGAILLTDLNLNSKKDFLFSAPTADYNGRTNSGSFYIVYNQLFTGYSETGHIIDLANSENFNIRFDGPLANMYLSGNSLKAENLNGTEGLDLIFGAHQGNYNSRNKSGSVYIVYNELFKNYLDTGHTIDLANSENFNIRFDGAGTNHKLGEYNIVACDINNDQEQDVIISSAVSGFNSRTGSGSVYILYNEFLKNYLNTGHTIDLADPENFNIRIDGSATSEYLSAQGLLCFDFTQNNKNDLFINASSLKKSYFIFNSIMNLSNTGHTLDLHNSSNYNLLYQGEKNLFGRNSISRDLNNNGKQDLLIGEGGFPSSVYIIYNFPHTINLTTKNIVTNKPKILGSISAPNSVTPMLGVQYQLHSDDVDGDWQECNISVNNFRCDINDSLSNGEHAVYIRSYDTNISYTSQSHYATTSFFLDTSPPSLKATPQLPKGINVRTGQVVTTNPYIIQVNPDDTPSGIDKVEFYVDGNLICTTNKPNNEGLYECAWDTSKYQSDILVIVYDKAGNTVQIEVPDVKVSLPIITSPATTPFCSDAKPSSVPDLFQIDITDTTAKLYFTPISNTSNFYISFAGDESAEQHGELVTLTREGVQSHTVYHLEPNATYYFKVRGHNGCMPGEWSDVLQVMTRFPNLIGHRSFYRYFSAQNITTSFGTSAIRQTAPTTHALTGDQELKELEILSPVPTQKPETHSENTDVEPVETKKRCFLWWCW